MPKGSDRASGDDGQIAAKKREAERAAVREAKLAEALRTNLKRRKAQARGRQTPPSPGPDEQTLAESPSGAVADGPSET